MIRSSQIDGRAHDITLYIENAGRIAVTAKHDYPPGLYRAPSGGLHAGETLEQVRGVKPSRKPDCRLN